MLRLAGRMFRWNWLGSLVAAGGGAWLRWWCGHGGLARRLNGRGYTLGSDRSCSSSFVETTDQTPRRTEAFGGNVGHSRRYRGGGASGNVVDVTRLARNGRSTRRPGFILLFGARPIVSRESGEAIRTRCPRCGQEADLHANGVRHWFTIFFIPVFPISGKRVVCTCGNCGAEFPVSPDELRAQLAAAGRQQNERAIALYNSLRASPANAITLNELMTIYASTSEFDSAIAVAGEFPQALHNSEQCMTTLGRVYLARNRHAEALQWLNAAVERNPMLAEAQYYKALTHLLVTPPDTAAAVAAARAARSGGYPGADGLLREAEAKARG